MGVPVFFKWLSTRNPKIIKDAIESLQQTYMSTGNPYIDNFYIDMNGLIHPSCNPKGQNIKIPKDFQQQCANIYQYIDKLMNIVRPRKTLYLAIDGVAPRAKMNQQRSRRFRAAFQQSEKSVTKLEVLEKFKQQGAWSQQLEDSVKAKKFDSNVITPGTQFLSSVCVRLREYIKNRLENHKLWKNLIVVFSDANCPGEGQHKIMDFIRQQRSSPSYNPGQSHCIYGADADLIMLSLATHEPKFYIIRQVVITAMDKFCTLCQNKGHYFMDCKSATSIEDEARVKRQLNASSINVEFQFIRIQMVREFIHINYKRSIIPFGYNLQRIIDDFIFLCFFVGNDFLPHIPCLSIRQGGIDVLMKVYEYCLSLMPDYITNAGDINFKSLKIFVEEIAHYQETLIGEMIVRESNNKQRQMNNRNFTDRQKNKGKPQKSRQTEIYEQIDPRDPMGSFQRVMQKLGKQDAFNLDDYSVFDHKLYDYKQKYYREKFKISPAQFLQLKSNVSRCYLEALKWICGYYYKGVQSWSWFYPFHYSPFFTDLIVPEDDIIKFDIGMPFKPFEQLMAVLPARTCSALPTFLHYYMKDINSPIIDYYPENFHIDLVGKKFAWLGEVILPFIDDKRLLSAITNYQQKLTEQENHRNRFGFTNMYINRYGPLGRKINKQAKIGETLELSWQNSHQIEGSFSLLDQDSDFLGFAFEQPIGRQHSIALKEGVENALEQIDDFFIQRTDRAAFGGIRYVRIIERVMFERKDKLRSKRFNLENDQDKEDRGQGRNMSRSRSHQQRSRSRQKNKNYQRNYEYNNDRRNYHNNQRNYQNNGQRNYQHQNDQRNYQNNDQRNYQHQNDQRNYQSQNEQRNYQGQRNHQNNEHRRYENRHHHHHQNDRYSGDQNYQKNKD